VSRLDDFWYRKYGEDERGKLVRIAETEDLIQHSDGKHVHLPSPSYWPLVTALGLPVIGYGLLYTWWLCLIGGLIVVAGIYGWAMEPPDDPDAAHDDDHGPDDDAAEGELLAGAEAGAVAGDLSGEKEAETVG
jgi:cytochrome c oxidase subunit 1